MLIAKISTINKDRIWQNIKKGVYLMPIINSKTKKIIKDYSVEELVKKTQEMRAYSMIAITAALYLKKIRHDPANPSWEDRDRVFWSVGHKAPALYIALAEAGYFPLDDTVKLRKLWLKKQRYLLPYI